MKRIAWMTALALSAGLTTGAFADITGTVKLGGPVPERKPVPGINMVPGCAAAHKDHPVLDESIVADKNGDLANVVVSLKGKDLKGPVPKQPVVLDQKGCMYVPHVVALTVGQELIAENGDPFLHNVHTLSENNPPKNVAQIMKGQKDQIPIKAAETFKVKCDVHPWMNAWVAVFDNPYHAVTDEKGQYKIDTTGLADGDYEITFWQEKLAQEPKSEKITIKDGKPAKGNPVDFTIPEAKASAYVKTGAAVAVAQTTKSCCSVTSSAKLLAAK